MSRKAGRAPVGARPPIQPRLTRELLRGFLRGLASGLDGLASSLRGIGSGFASGGSGLASGFGSGIDGGGAGIDSSLTSGSSGVAGFPLHAEDAEDRVATAFEALRAAKAAGKNRVGLFSLRR